MKRACIYILIIAAVAGCNKSMVKESVSKAEVTLHYADSVENTTQPYADTAALQSALQIFIEQERTCEVAKTYYHLGNAYKSFSEDSLAFVSYAHAADLFLALSDSVYYPLSVFEMSLIAEQRYKENGNATMLQAIRNVQRKMILDKAESNRWKSLWWVLLIVIISGIGIVVIIIKRRKPTLIVPVTRAEVERSIELVLSQGNIAVTLRWREYDQFCKTTNAYLYNVVNKLQAEEQLTEQDIRFLVLVLLDLPAKEIADIMNLSQNSISNKKTRTAQKLGTIAADLRETIISLILKTKEQ
ncbi:MAG: hypothetical protein J5612_02645 [Paludibacteraceae bacterium]|nr:hypothetical protein [Paludibacteraceae bacterium]